MLAHLSLRSIAPVLHDVKFSRLPHLVGKQAAVVSTQQHNAGQTHLQKDHEVVQAAPDMQTAGGAVCHDPGGSVAAMYRDACLICLQGLLVAGIDSECDDHEGRGCIQTSVAIHCTDRSLRDQIP